MIQSGQNVELSYNIKNTDRTVGARLSSTLVTDFKDKSFNENQINIKLRGSAGQSLGAFIVKGINLEVIGDCNDYVGKGLSGGTIIVRPARVTEIETEKNTIIGNTVLYGATSGKLFASGQAGERFAVRNSGATAVVEGCGTNGCEYMTGGTTVFLGDVGDNFAAGMTGGMAFVFDPDSKLENLINPNSVTYNKVETDYWKSYLKNLVEQHAKFTKSKYSQKILYEWDVNVNHFVQVCPLEMLDKLDNPISNESLKQRAS